MKFLEEERRRLPPAGVASIPRGRVLTYSGVVIAPPDCLISEVAPNFLSDDHRSDQIFLSLKLPKVQLVDRTVGVIVCRYADNYFHWLFDVLPRLCLLVESGIACDWILVPRRTKFQRQSLEYFNELTGKLIDLGNSHLDAAILVVPTLPGHTGNPAKWVCEFLRARFLEKINSKPGAGRKLYISRWKCGTRKILNEPELLACLKSDGFEAVYLEDLSFLEQVSLFASAKIVVSAHGAGLSNLVFCQPGTGVVEIFSPSYVNVAYWSVSNQVHLNYAYVVGQNRNDRTDRSDARVHENIVVDPHEVEAAIAEVLFNGASTALLLSAASDKT